jgi:hypothetical protein
VIACPSPTGISIVEPDVVGVACCALAGIPASDTVEDGWLAGPTEFAEPDGDDAEPHAAAVSPIAPATAVASTLRDLFMIGSLVDGQ